LQPKALAIHEIFNLTYLWRGTILANVRSAGGKLVDAISVEALNAFSQAVQSLLAPVINQVFSPVSIIPVQVVPAGVGGFAGFNDDPAEDIVARRVEAQVVVTATADDAPTLLSAVSNISGALVADLDSMRQAGILSSKLSDLGPAPAPGPPGSPLQRLVTFEMTFEFLKIPAAGGDTIKQIPITVQVD
jgi:hypothetical protein